MIRRGLALLALTVLTGCGQPGPLGAVDAPPLDAAPGVPVERIWARDVGASAALELGLEPAAAGGRVYAAASDGTVTALEAASGAIAWTHSLPRGLSGGPAVNGGLVVMGSRRGEVQALAAADGSERWSAQVTSEVLAPAALGQGHVLVRSNDGRVFALDGENGERLWLYDRSVPPLTLRGSASPVLVRGGAIVGFDNGRLVALKLADGAPAWEATIGVPQGGTDLARMVDIDADPAVAGDAVYAIGYQSRLAALRLRDGEMQWNRDIAGFAGLLADGGRLYLPDAGGRLWALDRTDGSTLWQQAALAGLELTAPALLGEYLVVGASDGNLYWLDAQTGQVVGRRSAGGGRIVAPPLAVDGRLFALTVDGRLSAWRLER